MKKQMGKKGKKTGAFFGVLQSAHFPGKCTGGGFQQ